MKTPKCACGGKLDYSSETVTNESGKEATMIFYTCVECGRVYLYLPKPTKENNNGIK